MYCDVVWGPENMVPEVSWVGNHRRAEATWLLLILGKTGRDLAWIKREFFGTLVDYDGT